MSSPEIRFSLSEGMTDNTIYSFASETRDFAMQEELMVGHDRLPDGVRDVDSLVKNRLGEMRAVAPGEMKVTEDAPVRLGSLPARRLDLLASAEGHSIRTLDLFAVLPDRTYMQLSYHVRLRDGQAAGRLDHIASSLRAADQAAEAAAPGFARRQAGAFTLDVPLNLRPPSDYIFLFPGGQGRMEMRVWRPGDPNPPAQISTLMAQDAAAAEHIDSEPAEAIQSQGAAGQIERYTLSKKRLDDIRKTVVSRARIRFPSGTVASLTARCDERFGAQVDSQFAQFVHSLREE
jgi:hypothetical protein